MAPTGSSNLPFAQTFASSAIAACTAEVRSLTPGKDMSLTLLFTVPTTDRETPAGFLMGMDRIIYILDDYE